MKKLLRRLFPDKEMRAYRKMYRRHRKELIKLAKETREWDWSWLDEAVRTYIKHMHEYFLEGNNVWQTDETRFPIIEQLQHVLDLYNELDGIWSRDTKDEDGFDSIIKIRAQHDKERELYEEIYTYIGRFMRHWWD